ncbi:MAG: 3-hydroxybutyryl-CoA dehydrogenase [Syntrophorhabdus sp. PtaU1.Bin058]|nr:MAG: 3-hydroxybutyryl-CoA dehydrogenase [Syntrophorhabdus sp. PtaU1.Bin058]
MAIKNVGIIGCGTMGAGIAQIALQAGYLVTVNEVSRELLDKGLERIRGSLDKMKEKGLIDDAHRDEMAKRLSPAVTLNELNQCDLVIEAVVESLDVKAKLFAALDSVCKKEAIFASNTSSLSVTQIAAATSRLKQFAGLHFFNPPALMPLVEVIRTMTTDETILQEIIDFVKSLKKAAIVAKDSAGFIVNRLLTPYLLDAMRAVGDGVGSVEDIDAGMKLGCNHPMGPLMLADFIGLDVLYNAANILFEEYREQRYAPPPILKRLVIMGCIGTKAGTGFYDWSDLKRPRPALLSI